MKIMCRRILPSWRHCVMPAVTPSRAGLVSGAGQLLGTGLRPLAFLAAIHPRGWRHSCLSVFAIKEFAKSPDSPLLWLLAMCCQRLGAHVFCEHTRESSSKDSKLMRDIKPQFRDRLTGIWRESKIRYCSRFLSNLPRLLWSRVPPLCSGARF